MKNYHVYQTITRTGQNSHTEFTFQDENKAKGLVELINRFGNGKITGFIHTTEA